MAKFLYEKISIDDLRDEEKSAIEMIKGSLSEEWCAIPIRATFKKESKTKTSHTLFLFLIHPQFGQIISNINCIQETQLKEKDQRELFREVTISYNEEEFFKDLIVSYLSIEKLNSSMSWNINDDVEKSTLRKNVSQSYSSWIPAWPILFLPYVSQTFVKSIEFILDKNFGNNIVIIPSEFFNNSLEKKIADEFYECNAFAIAEYKFSSLEINDVKFLKDNALDTSINLNIDLENLDEAFWYPDLLFYYELATPEIIQHGYEERIASNDKAELKPGENSCSDDIEKLTEKHFAIKHGDTGYTYKNIFGRYLKGASKIKIYDAYIRINYQINNFIRVCDLVAEIGDVKAIELTTKFYNEYEKERTVNILNKIAEVIKRKQITLTIRFNEHLHDRKIELDNGWVIKIGRGLDIYQSIKPSVATGLDPYEFRPCKETEVDIYQNPLNH